MTARPHEGDNPQNFDRPADSRRSRSLSDQDIEALLVALDSRGMVHKCRYDMDPEEWKHIYGVLKSAHDTASEVGVKFRKALIKLFVMGTIFGAIYSIAGRFTWGRKFLEWLAGVPK